jgi:hypothetical protein
MRFIWSILIVIFVGGCTQESVPEVAIEIQQTQSEVAIEFARTGNYELLSDEDKSVYTKEQLGSSWSQLNRYLEPTSKYFELEKFLIDKISFKVTAIKENEVVITTIYPALLTQISFQLMDDNENIEKLDNLYLSYQRKNLTPSDFKFEQTDRIYRFTDSGIFLNLALKKKKEDLENSISQYTDMGSELFKLILYSSTNIEKFNLLLDHSKNLEKIIAQVQDVKNKLLIIDSKYESYAIENFLKNANKTIDITRKFYELKNNIEYKDVVISKAKGGHLAIFGSYKYLGKENIKYSHFIAKFFDESGVLISKQKLEYFASDLFYGKVKSFGVKINDQFVAKSASKVEIEPISIF